MRKGVPEKPKDKFILVQVRRGVLPISATRLSWLFSFRSVALRPRFSTSLPFRSPALSNNNVLHDLSGSVSFLAKNMPLNGR
jgi:hypothetical protein